MKQEFHKLAYNIYDVHVLCMQTNAAATAAADKSLQSCPTPSDPMDCSPPGSFVHGIFQARVLEWGAIDFSMQTNTCI